MSKLVVRRAARLDVSQAFDWYEAEGGGVGVRFLAELDTVLERARQSPRQFPKVDDFVHRALLRRFPFSVYFVERGDAVTVLAVLHQHRSPGEWQQRTKRESAL